LDTRTFTRGETDAMLEGGIGGGVLRWNRWRGVLKSGARVAENCGRSRYTKEMFYFCETISTNKKSTGLV